VHFIQMWVVPDTPGISPGYEQMEIGTDLDTGALVTVATGMDRYADASAVRIRNAHAALHAARLEPSGSVTLPEAPWIHVFVARGAVDLEGYGLLNEGDAARLTGSGGHRLTAVNSAEVLVWEMHATLAI